MTDELRQAAQAALNALESTGENDGYAGVTQFYDSKLVDAAEKALREALAEQPAGEYPPLPDLGAGIYRHPTLGDLYDRLQVEQRMVAYADRVKQAAPQPEAQAAPAVGDDLRDRLVAIGAAIADQDDRSAQAMLREILAAPQQEVQEPVVAAVFDKQLGRPVLVEGAPLLKHGQPLYTAQPAPKQEVQERIPDAWTNLLAYVLQGDMHNRLTPRVVDIAYSAFMLAKQPNTEDGGASDWFNDTKPAVTKMIEKLRKDLIEEFAAQSAPSGDVSKSGEESNMSDTELLDFICDNDRQRMVEQSGGFWRVYQDEAPLEAEHHLWQSMTSRRYSTAREAISAARKEGK